MRALCVCMLCVCACSVCVCVCMLCVCMFCVCVCMLCVCACCVSMCMLCVRERGGEREGHKQAERQTDRGEEHMQAVYSHVRVRTLYQAANACVGESLPLHLVALQEQLGVLYALLGLVGPYTSSVEKERKEKKNKMTITNIVH